MTEAAIRRVGVVGLPKRWSSEIIADRIEARTGFRLIVDMSEVRAELSERAVWYRDINLCTLDALIIKKVGPEYSSDLLDRLELLRFVESTGVRVFSKPDSILRLLNRLSCTVTLASSGIPMPKTTITESLDVAMRTVERYGEAIFKPLFSTKARGMALLNAKDPALEAKIAAFRRTGNPVMYIQKLVESPGRDLGVMFLAGNHIGTYARVKTNNAWNTTTAAGGRYESHAPSAQVIELAHRAQALFNVDITGVDVVETTDGPLVFEVSAFGGFTGLREAQGVDAADLYVEHVLKSLS